MGAIPAVFIAFLFGLCVGSFLNVCIHRIPSQDSISDPQRSICPRCRETIRWYDNIPVLSYLWLRGRCRHCQNAISPRYPLVEILGGLFACAVLLRFGPTPAAVVYYAFIATLLVVTFIDIDLQIIPDVITLPGIPLFFLASLAVPTVSLQDSIAGIILGGGSLYLIRQGYYLLKNRPGMGLGDVKLLAMIGALIGWQGILLTVFVGSAIGTVVGMLLMVAQRVMNMQLRIPFGPFLAIGAITHIFWGRKIIFWYLGLME